MGGHRRGDARPAGELSAARLAQPRAPNAATPTQPSQAHQRSHAPPTQPRPTTQTLPGRGALYHAPMTWTKWAAIAAIILFLALAWPALMHQFAWWLAHDRKAELANMGTLGDSYGLLTSVFSGVTTLLLLFTIGKQMEAVQAQKDAVSLQRDLFGRQLEEESKRARHERTMWLVETYNSPDMRRARSRASALVQSLERDVRTLSELETEQVAIRARVAAGQTVTESQKLRLEEITSLFTVLFFYDTWAKLHSHGSIENRLALDFFAPAAQFYTDNYCRRALTREGETWSELLRRIVTEVGEPSTRHLAGRRA